MQLRPFLFAYYAYAFLYEFLLGYAIYTAYFALSGMGVWEIALLFVIWSALAAIFEIPSGALSDHLDRRALLIAAPLIKALAFVIWAVSNGAFAIAAAGFVIWSFANSLVSGSKQALLYEHMEAADRSEDYDRVLGRDRAAQISGAGIAMVLGGIVGQYSMELALWLALPPLLLASVTAIFLRDIRNHSQNPADRASYFSHFSEAAREFRSVAELRFLTAYLVFGVMVFYILEEFDPLYYLALGIPIWAFGLIALVATVAYAAASALAHRFDRHQFVGWSFPLISGAFLMIAGMGHSVWLLIPLLLAYIMSAPPLILAEARFQRAMGGASRATTTSALIVFHCIASIAMCIAFGLIAERAGIQAAYGWCGAYLVGFGVWAAWRDREGQSAI